MATGMEDVGRHSSGPALAMHTVGGTGQLVGTKQLQRLLFRELRKCNMSDKTTTGDLVLDMWQHHPYYTSGY